MSRGTCSFGRSTNDPPPLETKSTHTHQLHRMEADHNVLLQHLIPAHLVFLPRAVLAAHLQPHILQEDAGWMDGLSPHHCHSCCPHLIIVKKNGCRHHIWRGRGRNNLLRRCTHRGKREVVGHTLAARSLGLVNKSDGGGDSFLQARAPLPRRVWVQTHNVRARLVPHVPPDDATSCISLPPTIRKSCGCCRCCRWTWCTVVFTVVLRFASYFLFHVNKVHQRA